MEDHKTGVILEEVRDMFKTLAEGQKIIEDDVKELKSRVGNVENRVANIEMKVDIIEMKADIIEQRVESIDNRLTRVGSDVKTIKGYIMGVDDTPNDHEKRISTLENKVAVS